MKIKKALILTLLLFPHLVYSQEGATCYEKKEESTCSEDTDNPLTCLGNYNTSDYGVTLNSEKTYYPITVNSTTPEFFSVLFKTETIGANDWTITIHDLTGRLLQTYGASDFQEENSSIWTPRLKGRQVTARLALADKNSDASIKIVGVLTMPESTEYPQPLFSSKEKGKADYQNLYCNLSERANTGECADDQQGFSSAVKDYQSLGDSVGLLVAARPENEQGWCCSGVVIADNLFLTNYHCGGGDWNDVCNNTIIDMSWDGDDKSLSYMCQKTLVKEKELDITILEIDKLAGSGAAKPARLSSELDLGDPLVVIHHPECMTKQISHITCLVNGFEHPYNLTSFNQESEFVHTCDTKGGSSGAPMFNVNDGLRVAGIHHEGHQKVKIEGDEENNEYLCDKLNKAIRMDSILDFLENNHGDVYKRLYLE